MITDRKLLERAIAAKLATAEEIEYYNRPPAEPDPLEWADPDVRIEACIRACSSGVWAECPPPSVVVPTDHRILVPPGHRPRRSRSKRS
jgi:hypothetical protein